MRHGVQASPRRCQLYKPRCSLHVNLPPGGKTLNSKLHPMAVLSALNEAVRENNVEAGGTLRNSLCRRCMNR